MPAVSATKEGHTRNDLEWLGNSIRPILRVVITVRCHRSPGVGCAEAVSIVGDMPRGMENEIVRSENINGDGRVTNRRGYREHEYGQKGRAKW